MGNISFGGATLEYSIRRSSKAKKKRIEITPYSIEVISPDTASVHEIEAYITEKAKDVFIAQEKLRLKNRSFFQEKDQFFSGGKVSFRGRRLAVIVEKANVGRAMVVYKSRFYVSIPLSLQEEDIEKEVGGAIKEWLRIRLHADSEEISNTIGKPHGLSFKAIRVREQKNIWATCGKDGILHINKSLIKVPRKVLEYVIAHELAHLRYRNHSEDFWRFVGTMIPEYKTFQALLDGM